MANLNNNVFTLNKYVEFVLDGTISLDVGFRAGWYAGGGYSSLLSSVDRISFYNETSAATAKGPLDRVRNYAGSFSTINHGWFGGGYNTDNYSSTVKITFASDTATGVAKGSMAQNAALPGGFANSTDGWFYGGYTQGSPSPLSSTSRMIFASDTAAGVGKGKLSTSRQYMQNSGVSNTTDGWAGGGLLQPTAACSIVDRMIFSSDTATMVAKGGLTVARYGLASGYTPDDGWFGGGYGQPGFKSTVDRIIFASDTATTVAKGSLTRSHYLLASSGNASGAWFSGGSTLSSEGGAVSIIDKVTFVSDTAAASSRGTLTAVRHWHNGA